jgi:hypothetical protein
VKSGDQFRERGAMRGLGALTFAGGLILLAWGGFPLTDNWNWGWAEFQEQADRGILYSAGVFLIASAIIVKKYIDTEREGGLTDTQAESSNPRQQQPFVHVDKCVE